MPSRYLGTESNRIIKDFSGNYVKIALAFPDLYEIGTSHFGIQILYHMLNKSPHVLAERVYAPARDAATIMKNEGLALTSMENRKPLTEFDIIGFSLLYELNYTNVLYMLDLAGLPFRAADRNSEHPIIIAGGPCTGNPESVAPFFDAIVIGDGEAVINELTESYRILSKDKKFHQDFKALVLKEWSHLDGVYVPSLFREVSYPGSFTIVAPIDDDSPKAVKRAICPDLNLAEFPEKPIVPFGKPVHDRLRIEISRGCTRGCRFCQAGMFYRPARERSPENIITMTKDGIAATGYEDISLLSLSSGDYSKISDIMEQVMNMCEPANIAVSLPSLRADSITEDLMKHIKRVRKTGFTIAPEAGTQRLRQVINKNLTEDEILKTVETVYYLGWQTIKLYFMIGLPTETEEDLNGIVELVQKIRSIKRMKNRKGDINVSVSSFIPKPHTPFQWERQMTLEESKEKIFWLMDHLKFKDVKFKWQNPHLSRLEGVFARGDRSLSKLLEKAFQLGIAFDGWSDQFKPDLWDRAFEETGIDPLVYLEKRDIESSLPWDHIDIGVTKIFMKSELEKAIREETTKDCKTDACQACGVCDFKRIQPITYKNHNVFEKASFQKKMFNNTYVPVNICFSKTKNARYFGHIEQMNIFSRAFARTGIPLMFSEGFHPVPKMVFKDTLPIGMASLNEFVRIWIPENVKPEPFIEKLNAELPDGLIVNDVYFYKKEKSASQEIVDHYVLSSKLPVFRSDLYELFSNSPDFMIKKKSKKNLNDLNLKDFIHKMKMLDSGTLTLSLKSVNGKILRPKDVIVPVFQLDEASQNQMEITKL